jgi:hypothetical protein
MKTFMAIYMGSEAARAKSGWETLSADDLERREAEGMAAWMAWGEKHAAAIVDQGAPLGKTKRAAAEGITNTTNGVTGYVIVRADSHEAAARMFESHPHFTIFPGDSVEIMECLPLPGR